MSGYTAAATLTMAVVSAASQAYSSYEQGKTQQQNAENQAKIAKYNADIANYNATIEQQSLERQAEVARQNAALAEEQGREEAKTGYENKLKKRQEVHSLISSNRASMAGSGAVLDTGSLLDISIDNAEKGELDALAFEEQGFDSQYKYNVQAMNYLEQANAYQYQADSVLSGADAYNMQSDAYANQADSINPWASAGTSILGSAMEIGSNYNMMTEGSSSSLSFGNTGNKMVQNYTTYGSIGR